MASYNKVILIGNLTRDPELRMTPKGTAIAQLSIAVNRKFKDEQGGEREEVTYVDIDVWGKQAEVIQRYFTKGKPIFVEGRLKLDQWEDKTTKEKKSRLKVVMENFQFVGDRGASSSSPGDSQESFERSAPPARPGNARPAPAPQPDKDLEEDVPF